MRIGIDVGGVLVEKDGRGGGDTSFEESGPRFVIGALEAVNKLASEGHLLYIVSFCGAQMEARTRVALRSAGLAIPEERWYFTKSRPEKGPVCAKLGLDVFVDDTEPVVRVVSQACPNARVLWFRGVFKPRTAKFADNVAPVSDWEQVVARVVELSATLSSTPVPALQDNANFPPLGFQNSQKPIRQGQKK